jgi:hypothetical protein
MFDLKLRLRVGLAALAVLGLLAGPGVASAQKIVCWKDKNGKVVGCGDKIPPEFQSSATKELDRRGITRGTTESVDDAAQRRQREQEVARARQEDERRQLDQKRQDTALLETYTSEREIDQKRDRELQILDLQMEQLTTGQRGVNQRYTELVTRMETVRKNGKTPPKQLDDELARAAADKQRLEHAIDAKQKEKVELRERYAAYKKRYNDLRSGNALVGSAPAAPSTASAAPAPAKK